MKRQRFIFALALPLSLALAGCMPKRPVGGPVASGAAVFQAQGCAHCHAVNGVGGHKGPDLTHVGARLTEQQIDNQIVNGGDAMPAYKDVLSPGETKLLVRYLQKLR